MLTPKTLLAETAKFFKLHPDRFTTGSLTNRGDPADACETDCFCTVGYMAYRLAQAGYPNVRGDAYRAVANFFDGKYESDASELYEQNDHLAKPEEVANFLIEEARNADA